MSRAFLVRVGIDSTHDCGKWNAPVNTTTGEWVYVPLLQSWPALKARPELRRSYKETVAPLERFSSNNGRPRTATLPARLSNEEMHLDPDFEHLTYGDSATPRGTRIAQFVQGDWMVFIAGLKPTTPGPLCYAIIGKFEVAEVVPAATVPRARAHENAHTRPPSPLPTDTVIRATPGASGRLACCISIGELRGARPRYRVRHDLLEEWGGLNSNDGYIQRGSPFELANPTKFREWWGRLNPPLVRNNWS